ncbi:MAG: membrane protein insertase YidC [Acidobacteriota bacterium]
MNNQDPNSFDMEKRIFLVLILSLAILMVVPYFLQRLSPPAPTSTSGPAQQATRKPAVPSAQPTSPEIKAEAEQKATQLPPTSAPPQTVEIENADLLLKWNNRGTVLQSALLKRLGGSGDKHEALELIPQSLPATLPRPFQLRLEDEDLDKVVANAHYRVETGGRTGRIRAPADVTFTFRSRDLEVIRKVHVPASGYVVDMQVQVRAEGKSLPYSIFLGPGIGAEGYNAQGDFSGELVAYEYGGSVERYRAQDLAEGPQRLEVPARWVAMDSQYFSYLILDTDGVQRMVIKKSDWIRTDDKGKEYRVPLLTVQVGLDRDVSFRSFLGPKDYEILRTVDPGLVGLIDYGWFAWLVKPLLFLLKFVYHYVGNYGWAIIILTFIINLALFPVRYKQMVSMKKMSELQPKIRSIQDRYKRLKRDDPRRQDMNAEMMALYKEHGVNPLGGCLPLLVQMPFLFAFYRMLLSSFELRGAPFMLWIQDLSKHDPYYVTPIVMGVTMLLQQMMTPTPGQDPTQRRMMMILPVMFTFFFLNMSSGLTVYFLFSNVFGMMFQLGLQKWSPDLMKPAVAGAKKR